MRYFFINYSVPKRIHHAVYHLKALSAKHWGKKRHIVKIVTSKMFMFQDFLNNGFWYIH